MTGGRGRGRGRGGVAVLAPPQHPADGEEAEHEHEERPRERQVVEDPAEGPGDGVRQVDVDVVLPVGGLVLDVDELLHRGGRGHGVQQREERDERHDDGPDGHDDHDDATGGATVVAAVGGHGDSFCGLHRG